MREDRKNKKNGCIRPGKRMYLQLISAMLCLSLCLLLASCTASPDTSNNSNNTYSSSPRLLVFSKTTGFRHISIKDGLVVIRTIANEHHVAVDATEDATIFTLNNLRHYKAVIFLSTTGTILDSEQKTAFEQYIRAGGGYVGIHSASDTEYDWSWYGQLVGAYFKSHPPVQQAAISVEDAHNVSTSMLPHIWERTDEWYNFRTNPRNNVHVLLTVSEATYQGGTMGKDHPISWYHTFDGGRSWYTGMGHTESSFHEPLFQAHIWGGIVYAAHLSE